MLQNDEEKSALKLAETIEDAANNPEKAAKRMEEKTGSKGILGTIFDFVKDYKNKGSLSDEEWIKQQYAKPEYAKAWKGGENESFAAAENLIKDIDDYDNAKRSLETHIELGGTRESWLARQIEIGAAANGKDLAEYAKEVSDGLEEAMEENSDFLLGDSNLSEEAK